ncbi:hypothetical protein KAZ66_04435 [Candidatus Woesebacteria bacterium]|jgi:uncharacterized membrane protein YdcZ (DUF606 family)|nr:hypothetical protein [Candidatus Paceibacterota bacterium]MBP7967493.1 hypothetical protein [Candidatus Woesebacteria bacterium]
MKKFINYLQITVIVAVLTAAISSLIAYNTYGFIPKSDVVEMTIGTILVAVYLIGLREIRFLKPKSDINEAKFWYFFTGVFSVFFTIGFLWGLKPMSNETALYCLMSTSAIAAVIHPRYSLAANIIAVTIALWAGFIGIEFFFKDLGILTLLTLVGTFIKFLFFMKWSNLKTKETGNVLSIV